MELRVSWGKPQPQSQKPGTFTASATQFPHKLYYYHYLPLPFTAHPHFEVSPHFPT